MVHNSKAKCIEVENLVCQQSDQHQENSNQPEVEAEGEQDEGEDEMGEGEYAEEEESEEQPLTQVNQDVSHPQETEISTIKSLTMSEMNVAKGIF